MPLDSDRPLEVRALDLEPRTLEACAAMLQRTFPRAKHVTAEYLHWEYCENPDGKAFGWNAMDGERVVSHCVVQPLRARLFGEEVRGVLSLNAATDVRDLRLESGRLPSYQRGGSYFDLVRRTYADARDRGYRFGVGVSNARSTAGFVSRAGFQLVAPLDVRIGPGVVRRRSSAVPAPVDLEKLWSRESLAWRLRCPTITYGLVRDAECVRIYGSAGLPGMTVPMAEVSTDVAGSLVDDHPSGVRLLDVWVGLDPGVDWRRSLHVALPNALRPSPLNLIFLDLSGEGRELDPGRVRWRALDFDDF